MDERLKKDGIKSHKERVEEFNKYLSNLSEHHDMLVLAVPPVVFLAILTCIGLVLGQANIFRGKVGCSIGVFFIFVSLHFGSLITKSFPN